MAKRRSGRCTCKRGKDGRKHCFKMVKGGKHLVGCKRRGK